MQMDAHMDEFEVAVPVNLWLWFHSMLQFPNISEKYIHIM